MDHASNASVSSLEASGSQVGSPHNVPVQAQDVLGTEEIGRVCDIRDAMNENLSEIASPINLSGALDKQALHGGENESTLHRATIGDAHSSSASTSQGTKATPSLFNNPPILERIRKVLFECKDPALSHYCRASS